MAGTRTYVAGKFFLNLDGVKCGFVKSVEGGGIKAEVIEEALKDSYFTRKHIGQPKYEEFELAIGFELAQAVYDWIAASWQMSYQRKNGSIVAADFNFQAKSEREFSHALLTETTIPALDAASKEPAFLTLKFAPEFTRAGKASGKLTAPKTVAQKQFVASNFRLELDGLDTTKVSKIDSFSVKQTIAEDDIGEERIQHKEPTSLEVPNLRVTIAEAGAATWASWFDDFVVKGNCDDSHEKSGAIVFLSPNRQQELGRVILHNVGIFALAPTAATSATEQVARLVAELYCERMELQIGKPAKSEPKPIVKPVVVDPQPMPLPRRPIPLPPR